MCNTFTANQEQKIKANLNAFIVNFGEPTIKKVTNGKGFLVFRPGEEPREDNYVQYCENIDYLNGWLYGCVQTGVGQIKVKEKNAMVRMVTRNEYYNYIRETGRIPKDDEMQIAPLDLSAYNLSEDTKRSINELGLSPRAFNGLMRNNVTTIRELVKFESAEELLTLKSVGKTSVEEIYRELDKWQQAIIKEKKVA